LISFLKDGVSLQFPRNCWWRFWHPSFHQIKHTVYNISRTENSKKFTFLGTKQQRYVLLNVCRFTKCICLTLFNLREEMITKSILAIRQLGTPWMALKIQCVLFRTWWEKDKLVTVAINIAFHRKIHNFIRKVSLVLLAVEILVADFKFQIRTGRPR
jgi:hypothetical protein